MSDSQSSISAFLHRKNCVYTQFIKYIFCGGISVLVDQVVFYALALMVLPALRLSDPIAKVFATLGMTVQEVSEQQLKTNYWIIKIVCFAVSNAVVYILNVLFVFHDGRHHRVLEILMFFGFSLLQFFYVWLGSVLIYRFEWEVTYANLGMLILGITTNYIARKKIVFKG